MFDKHGRPMEREPGVPEPRTVPPDCVACPKNAPGAEILTPRNFQIYKTYVLCKALGCLPRAGGLMNQDSELVAKMGWAAMIDRQREIAKYAVQKEIAE